MKKKLNNLLNLTLCLIMLFGLFGPLGVMADGALVFNFSVGSESGYSLSANGTAINVTKDADNNVLGVHKANGDSISEGVSVTCSTTTSCTMSVTGQSEVTFRFNGSAFSLKVGNNTYVMDQVLTSGANIEIVAPSNNQGNDPQNPGEDPGLGEEQSKFDGKAVLYWSCGTGTCYHVFNNLSATDVNMIAAASVTADNDNTKTFDVNAENKFFGPKASFDAYVASNNPVNWSSVTTASLMGEGLLDYAPVPTPSVEHAYVSYANRNFKAYVYDTQFKAISRGLIENLSYYPGCWADGLLRQDFFSISGTTKENPVVINNVILEPNVLIEKQAFNVIIKSIEPLDVPEGAVSVNLVDNVFKITFSSRFYDKVVFKLTDDKGKTYYFMVNRIAAQAKIDHDNKGNEFIFSSLYFDRSTTYSDYIVKAKILYKDGTNKTVEMTNANYVDDGLGNTSYNVKEVDSENPIRSDWTKGKGIKIASYQYSLKDEDKSKIAKIYVNVEFKGSTSTNYAGTYVGSGNGVVIEMGD
jgi:hypothetical protein